MVDEAGALERLGLGAVPALVLHEARQQLALELRARLVGQAHAPGHHAAAEEAVPVVEQHQRGQVVERARLGVPARRFGVERQAEPEEAVGRQRQQVGQIADRREGVAPGHLDRHAALELAQFQLHRLRGAADVGHAQDGVVLVLAHIGQHLAVARVQHGEAAAAEGMRGGCAPRACAVSSSAARRSRATAPRRSAPRSRRSGPGSAAGTGAAGRRGRSRHCDRWSTASACARRRGRRGRCCRPCRSRRRSTAPACPASTAAGCSSARCARGRSPATAPGGGGCRG